MQHSAGRDVLAGEPVEAGPVEPVPLASAQQGMPPCATHLGAEGIQPKQVRRNCMIREVPIQDPLKPRANNGHGLVSLLARRPVIGMLGWLLHILIDVPTHSKAYYATKIFWPLSDWGFDGIPWWNRWFWALNPPAMKRVLALSGARSC